MKNSLKLSLFSVIIALSFQATSEEQKIHNKILTTDALIELNEAAEKSEQISDLIIEELAVTSPVPEPIVEETAAAETDEKPNLIIKELNIIKKELSLIKEEFKAVEEKYGSGHITAKVSTMGLGVEYTHPINAVLSIGFGVNKFNEIRALSEGDIDYDADIDLKSLSMIANYHPWENGFRLRGGAYYNKNEISLDSDISGEITIGDTTYNADVTLDGAINFKAFAPYIGVGYGSEPIGDNNLSLDIDVGVMKSPVSATLTGTCDGTCDGFDDELAKEQAELAEAIENLDFYPVISLGLSYRF
jgi:hypothetical protein